jgi:integrase
MQKAIDVHGAVSYFDFFGLDLADQKQEDDTMAGMDDLTAAEFARMLPHITGRHRVRNVAIFYLIGMTGERISAVLSLQVGDVVRDGRVVDTLVYRRATRKGKRKGRSVGMNVAAKAALGNWLNELCKDGAGLPANSPLFPSAKTRSMKTPGEAVVKPITRRAFLITVKRAAAAAGVNSKRVGCHSLRKFYAQSIYEKSGHNAMVVKTALGHSSLQTTQHYLNAGAEEAQSLTLSLANDVPQPRISEVA